MPLAPEQLDLSKSADSQEKFRTKRLISWEVTPFVFYVAALIGAFMAFRGMPIMDRLDQLQTVIAFGLIVLLGLMIGVSGWKIFQIKRDNDYRRAILVSVLEGQSGGHLITDARQRTIYANTRFQKILHYTTALNISELPLYTTSGNDEVSDNLRDFIEQSKTGITGEMVFPFSQAELHGWYRLSVRPIDGWKGYIHWQLEDISKSYEDNQRLGRERVRLIEFLDHAPVGFFSVDESGTFIFANDTFVAWLGAEDRDLCGGGFRLHDLLIDAPEGTQAFDILPDDGDHPVQRGEIKMRAFDGREFQAAISHTILRGTDGTVRTRSIIRDLTPERAWKTALKQSEDRFQRFFEEAPLGIALVDVRGQITECNDAFAQMINRPLHELLGSTLMSLVRETSQAKTEAVFTKARSGQKADGAIEVEFSGPSEDKSVVTQMFASPFMGENGVVLHFINVTERKNLEAQFTQSQKMQAVGQLAGGIAHDFNNLLTAMIGFCDLLLMRHRAGDPSFADIMQIKQNANRAANLVRQLLAFSRQQTLQPKVMDVTDVITDVSHLLRRLIGAGIDLKINHERDLGLIKVDQGQMEQVLVNLAVNARDAMGHTGTLTIKTRNFINKQKRPMVGTDEMPPGEWVAIDVGDTGTGMPPEVVARIFDPFFSTKPLGQGTGLGLSTVYGIVRQSNGYVGVDTVLGRGTTFSIYMPRAEAQAVAQVAAPVVEKVEDLTGSSRILLCEDEDAVRSFSVRALQNKGYEVFEASSGDNALEMLKEKKPKIDLMVSDVMMPGMDGIELGKHVRELYPNLTIIFMSGYTEDKFKDDMGPGIHFLAKPFTLKQLAEKVKEVLDGVK